MLRKTILTFLCVTERTFLFHAQRKTALISQLNCNNMAESHVFKTTTVDEHSDAEDASFSTGSSRPSRANIAKDTLEKLKAGWYESPDGTKIVLEDDVTFSNQQSILYTEDDLQNTKQLNANLDETNPTRLTSDSSQTKIETRLCSTLEAARSLVAEVGEDHVGVLNFASAKNPGGGFLGGAQAQEESIARSSSLYMAITQDQFMDGFYSYHRHGERGVYSHRMIYSPRITIFRNDNGYLLPLPYHVGIITCPAPNAGVINDRIDSRNLMSERIKRVLYVFKAHKHDTLLLGAFGCGVFKNNPYDVALVFREQLESNLYKNSFKRIVFAITNPAMYQIFKQVFDSPNLHELQQQMALMTFNQNKKKHSSDKNRKQQRKERRQQKYQND
ncbi:unnamed protein product [Adineta ricciae]|uniref:Microbial-type PARG catalytic domain-containing protein n=2 Tax=Adineta ricciae TaxID=249248 RepID=A0A815CIM0_ADIRI|nr:unnamed protein product [Adineta ricciae]